MNNYYHIEGTEKFGYSIQNRCWYSFYLFMNTVKRVCSIYNNASVHDLNGYASHFLYRRLKAFDTLIKVVEVHKDYLSSNCILRMLGDSVAVFNLIYMESDSKQRWLRHALYVIEGCEQNLKVLPKDGNNEDVLPEEEVKIFNERLRHNIEHRHRLMKESQQVIDASPLKNRDKEAFEKIVKDRNWKFKTFKTYKNRRDNQYTWEEMYDMINEYEGKSHLSFLSQYVHSLSMSNLVMEMNIENRDGVLIETTTLIDKLNEYALKYFAMDILHIMNGLFDPEMRDKLLSCYDEKHRPSIEQWNKDVQDYINRINGGR